MSVSVQRAPFLQMVHQLQFAQLLGVHVTIIYYSLEDNAAARLAVAGLGLVLERMVE